MASKPMINDDDDDSENDSDYNPDNDAEASDDGGVGEEVKGVSKISFRRKTKMDTIWDEMKALDEKETRDRMSKAFKHVSIPEKMTRKRKHAAQFDLMLRSIFGGEQAKSQSKRGDENLASLDPNTIKAEAEMAVKQLRKKVKVAEVRKFAGQEISVERTQSVAASHSSSSSSSSSTAPSNNLDKVLDVLKGPKVISTVAKSSHDWDNFKEQEGLEDSLAVASKDGYLTKKEFLERCDYRAYENERDERLKSSNSTSR